VSRISRQCSNRPLAAACQQDAGVHKYHLTIASRVVYTSAQCVPRTAQRSWDRRRPAGVRSPYRHHSLAPPRDWRHTLPVTEYLPVPQAPKRAEAVRCSTVLNCPLACGSPGTGAGTPPPIGRATCYPLPRPATGPSIRSLGDDFVRGRGACL